MRGYYSAFAGELKGSNMKKKTALKASGKRIKQTNNGARAQSVPLINSAVYTSNHRTHSSKNVR
jgi:hypothetical protein